ncbi:MAG: Mu-like prophage major head subunit gpT family protein [Bacteroidota bacterium]
MIINQAALQSIYRGFKTIFNMALQAAKPLYTKVATEVPSSTKSEEYKWLGKIPKMREWVGDRVIQNLGAHDYTIKNKDWEVTIGVDRNDIEDDTIGVYTPLIQSMAESANSHPDEIVFGLLPKGFTETCYDKKKFFASDHPVGKAKQSNLTDAPLSHTAYAAARAAMMSLTDEEGKPLNIVPNLLVVPPALEDMGRKILMAELMVDGEKVVTNTYKGTAELLVVPWLAANPTQWFLMDVSKPIKPLIFQRRMKPEFVALDQPNDENVFMKKEIVYGTDSRDNAGFGLWQLAYGSTGDAQ